MNNNDKAKFTKAMLALGETFNVQVSKIKIEIYFSALSEYPIDRVDWAISEVIKKLKFFPRPAEIIEFLADRLMSPEEEWDRLISGAPPSEESMRALRAIGVSDVSMLDPDRGFYLGDRKVESIRREFMRFYQALSPRQSGAPNPQIEFQEAE